MDTVPGETRTLRRTMRDLVALSALPAVWAGYEPPQVAEGLADVLLSTLRLDLVFFRLRGQTDGQEIEVARTAGQPTTTDQTREIGRALAPWLDDGTADPAPSILNPAGSGTVHLVILRIGADREDGVLVAGSQQTGFPSEEDRLLLSVGANQAAAVLQRQRAEEAMRESEERYRSVIAAMQEGVVLLGADGCIRACNASAERILGLSAEEIRGRTPLDRRWRAIHEDGTAFPGEAHPATVTLRTGQPCSNVVMGVHKPNGALTWISINSQPLFRVDEAIPFAVVASFWDITERKQAEQALVQERYLLHALMDNLPDNIYFKDAAGRFLRINKALTTYFGLSDSAQAIGKTDFDFFTKEHARPAYEDEQEIIRTGQPVVGKEEKETWLDGRVRWVSTTKMPLRDKDGKIIGSFGVAREITKVKLAEEAMRESEHRWRSLTEALPQLVWSATPDGACDYFSTQWTQHTGVPESQLLGWRWLEVLHPDDREPTRRLWTDSVAGRGPYDVEYRVRRSDEVYRWFKTRGVPIRDGVGNIFKWFGTCTDITDLRRTEEALRESEERFRGTFENAAVGIAHVDVNGRFLRVNEKLCDILGYTREELLAGKFQDVTFPDDLSADLEQLAPLLRGELPSFSRDKRYHRKDGTIVWVAVSVSLQRDAAARPLYTISVTRDISHRKRLETEFRHAREVAEAANRAKDEFLANVSHEIRTPMNAILGMTELALDTPLTEDQRQCLRTVKSAADNLLGIINDLLDFSKIEAGKLDLDPADFSLRAALGDTLRALAVRAHRKGLELVSHVQPDVPDGLAGDAGRLRQILLNLVSNAIKFTDDGEVVVKVSMQNAECKMQNEGPSDILHSAFCILHFEVRDTGIGIPPDRQEGIFRAFEQEDASTTRKYGGTGLGLTIAARLVALMGGQITVDSEPGRGSTFAFTARFGRQPHPPAALAWSPDHPTTAGPPVLLHNLPVLIVDDNATNRRILEEWLRSWQMKPVAVGDGVAAMDALWHGTASGRPYPLVLLDARMPDVDGLALATQIRQRAELSATRIVLLTSGDRPGDLARFREQRVNAHLLKPVQQDELLETIYRVMSRTNGAVVSGGVVSGESAAAASPLTTHHSPLTTALRILVAEDNEFNAQLLEQLLERRGHHVRLANNGREALSLLGVRSQESAVRSQEPGVGTSLLSPDPCPLTPDFDLLLLDVHMPELDGFQVIQAIRQRERFAGGHLSVIALTARSRKEDRERCLAAGMDDFLAKPIQAADLWAAIDRVAGAHSPADRTEANLLDPRVLLAACGGDAGILEKISQTFRARLPDHLTAVQNALQDRDTIRLREAAHKLCGMVAAFSTLAGGVASDLEDCAAQGQFEEARPLVRQLETMAQELMQLVDGLSLETLQQQIGLAGDSGPTAEP